MSTETPLFERLAAAYVRGALRAEPELAGGNALLTTPLESLADAELAALVQIGRERGLRLHRFKRTMGLPHRITVVEG